MAGKPDYEAFIVKEGASSDKKSFWTKIGAGWLNKDGEGISLSLDALPVDGKIILRKWKDKKAVDSSGNE